MSRDPRKTHETFIIEGGAKLQGEIRVNGAKNAALKILAASLLSSEPCIIKNVPNIEDVERMQELLESIGVKVTRQKQEITIDPSHISKTNLDQRLVERIRTSILIVGPLLARFGEVTMPHPGGCNIGQRPIDIFLDGYRSFGANIVEEDGQYHLTAPKLVGATILLRRVSVTVTEEMMMTAVLAEGTTIIKNAAMEPEIIALAEYLNASGAKITGAGTSTISITGVKQIHGGAFEVMPDRIEAGTFVTLGVLTNSEITVTNCEPTHLESLWLHLTKAGAKLEIGPNFVTTKPHEALRAQSIVTHEYPGFVTDLQPPYTVLMTQAVGLSLIHETVFEGRLFYTDLLNSMGAHIIMCDPHRVVVNGPTQLRGRYLTSPDIRAGMALILAGLVASGTTTIDNIYQIERGYEKIAERLSALGAKISRDTK